MAFKTQFEFTLPKGFVDKDGNVHRKGVMRLATAKDEILTYAYAATRPEIYENWGTFPPSGLLLIGAPGCGKHMLARALATHTETSFVRIGVPRLVLDMIHTSAKAGEFLQKWSQILEEISPLTIFFDELEFSQTHDLGGPRALSKRRSPNPHELPRSWRGH